MKQITLRIRRRWALALVPLALAACGGDDDGDHFAPTQPLSCAVADRNTWLAGYMDDWYFWYKLAPRPDPRSYGTVDDFFYASLYTGTDPNFPADVWSFTESTESFNLFFGNGQTLGYGVAVNAIEVGSDTTQPLYVRYVEPQSPAQAAGVVRGDQVVSVNGRSAADLIAADDYSALTPTAAGQVATLVLRNAGGDRTVNLSASVFTLVPVQGAQVVTTPQGRKLGYVMVKDMIGQVQAPLETAFAQFKAAGISDVVLDLRYNGGGLVSTSALVASYVAGTQGSGHTYTTLLYNDRHTQANQSFGFSSTLASAAGVPRVFVLAGPRTCSASEQVINGLRGIGIDVIAIGDTTCGKPVGFLPTDDGCGTTYNAVNFESVNERNEGRYFDGFAPTCAVAEDYSRAIGAAADPLLVSAEGYADSGACPPAQPTPLASHRGEGRRRIAEPGERSGMIGR